MLYGERLKLAIEKRSRELQREIAPKEIAAIAERSVQNIYMILNNSKGDDQVLGARAHSNVARFLRVDPEWLLNEVGEIEPTQAAAPKWSSAAQDIADLFDAIPVTDKVRRAEAFNGATTAILKALRPEQAKDS